MLQALLRSWTRRSSRPHAARRRRSIHLETLEPRLAFHLGDLDPTFGAGGIVQTPFLAHQTSSDFVADIAVGPDDEIVEVGRIHVNGFRLGITKHLADGAVDTSFGDGGQVIEAFSDFHGDGGRVAIQSDGKIVVAAERDVGHLVVARYETDGRRDTSFGAGGVVDVRLGPGFTTGDVLVQPDEAIVVVGAIDVGAVDGFVVTDTVAVRLQGNGQLDSSFGDEGIAKFSLHDYREGALHVVRQTDGMLVLVGSANDQQSQRQIFAARLDEHGVLDAHFATGGVLLLPYGQKLTSEESNDVSVVVQSSGRLILSATRSTSFGVNEFNLLGITSTGEFDATFGVGGILTTTVAGRTDAEVLELIQRPDGRLLAVGTSQSNANELLLVQYQANGALDSSWGQSGISAVANAWSGGAAVALQSQERAIVTYDARDGGGRFDFGAIGLQSTGDVDTTFGAFGRVQTNFVADFSNARATDLVVQGDGKVVVAGNCQSEDNLPWCIARYQVDGALDPSFGVGGTLAAGQKFSFSDPLLLLAPDGGLLVVERSNNSQGTLHVERFDRRGLPDAAWGVQGVRDVDLPFDGLYAWQALLQSDGKILVAANTYGAGLDADIRLFRLNADGMLDTSFGSQGSVVLDDGSQGLSFGSTMFLDAAGRITVVLTQGNYQAPEIVVARYEFTGVRDGSWGSSGETRIPAGQSTAFCGAGAYLSDGDLLFSCSVDSSQWFVRLNDQGQPVESFGDQGIVQDPGNTNGVGGWVGSLVAWPQGGWAAVGWGYARRQPDQLQTLVQFFRDDGSLDTTAGDAGLLWIDRNPAASGASASALGPDGDLYLAGQSSAMIDNDFLVAKIYGAGGPYRPWHQATNPLNVSADAQGAIAPIDALLVINELNGPGARRLAAPSANVRAYAFIDVNHDGFVSPVDALLVINYLNQLFGAEGEVPLAIDQVSADTTSIDTVSADVAVAPPDWPGEFLGDSARGNRRRARNGFASSAPVS